MVDNHSNHSVKDPSDSPKSRETIDSKESLSDYEDYDKELLINSTKAAKLYSKHIPLSYLKNSSNISTNYFIDLMSLPKTLAILNIVFRLLNYDIYCFDLIRWANEGHIPYNNCLTCFPEDWILIFSDFQTFTSYCVPSNKTIHILSAKIAKYIKIESFPRPDLRKLLFRFTKDFNLPKDIVSIIELNYNLFEHFPAVVDRMSKNWGSMGMPSYERWTLLVIILVLKKIFVLNDSTEKQMSRIDDKTDDLFIWDEWESYSRLRLELIRSHIIPIYSKYLMTLYFNFFNFL